MILNIYICVAVDSLSESFRSCTKEHLLYPICNVQLSEASETTSLRRLLLSITDYQATVLQANKFY